MRTEGQINLPDTVSVPTPAESPPGAFPPKLDIPMVKRPVPMGVPPKAAPQAKKVDELEIDDSGTLEQLHTRVQKELEGIADCQRSGLKHAIRAGRYLIVIQHRIHEDTEHRDWKTWMQAHHFNPSTATTYMQLATRWPEIKAKAEKSQPVVNWFTLTINGALNLVRKASPNHHRRGRPRQKTPTVSPTHAAIPAKPAQAPPAPTSTSTQPSPGSAQSVAMPQAPSPTIPADPSPEGVSDSEVKGLSDATERLRWALTSVVLRFNHTQQWLPAAKTDATARLRALRALIDQAIDVFEGKEPASESDTN
jgi:hypothetical protein